MTFAPQADGAPAPRADRDAGAIIAFLRAGQDELRIDGPQMSWRLARAG